MAVYSDTEVSGEGFVGENDVFRLYLSIYIFHNLMWKKLSQRFRFASDILHEYISVHISKRDIALDTN